MNEWKWRGKAGTQVRSVWPQSLHTASHVGPLKHNSLISEQNSWGTSNILQVIKLSPSLLGTRDAEMPWTLALCLCDLSPPSCSKEGPGPLFFWASHRKPRHCQTSYPHPSFYSEASALERDLYPSEPQMVGGTSTTFNDSKSKWTKHWVTLCQVLDFSEPTGA